MRKLIKEKELRRRARKLLSEAPVTPPPAGSTPGTPGYGVLAAPAGPTPAALKTVVVNKFNDIQSFVDNASSLSVTDGLNVLRELTTDNIGSGVFDTLISDFRDKLVDYSNAVTGGSVTKTGSKINDVLSEIAAAAGLTYKARLTPRDDIRRFNEAIFDATEGYLGVGTNKNSIEEAIASKLIAQISDIPMINNKFNADAIKVSMAGRTASSGDDLYTTLKDEFTGFGNVFQGSNVGIYVIEPIFEYIPLCILDDVHGSDEEYFLNDLSKLIDLIDGMASGTVSSASPVASSTATTTPSTSSTTPATGTSAASSTAATTPAVTSTVTTRTGKITINPIIPVKPNRRELGGIVPKISDIIDENLFKANLVAGIRGDKRAFSSAHVYELEISFKKNQPEIDKPPLGGTHRPVLRGKLGQKNFYGTHWNGGMKDIFVDAFNDAIKPSVTMLTIGLMRRFKLRVIFDPGFYDPASYSTGLREGKNTVLIKGKDLLKIISPLTLKK